MKTKRGPPKGLRPLHAVSFSTLSRVKPSPKSRRSEFLRFKERVEEVERKSSLGGVVEIKAKAGKRLKPKIAPGSLKEMFKAMFVTPIEVIAGKMGKLFKWSVSFILGFRLNKARSNGRTNLEKASQVGKSAQFA